MKRNFQRKTLLLRKKTHCPSLDFLSIHASVFQRKLKNSQGMRKFFYIFSQEWKLLTVSLAELHTDPPLGRTCDSKICLPEMNGNRTHVLSYFGTSTLQIRCTCTKSTRGNKSKTQSHFDFREQLPAHESSEVIGNESLWLRPLWDSNGYEACTKSHFFS